jgi:hypothetical protein
MALVISAPERVAPTLAQQIFTIGSAVAGGLAGIVVAKEFVGVKDVPVSLVAGATLVSVIFTLGAGLYLARKVHEAYY